MTRALIPLLMTAGFAIGFTLPAPTPAASYDFLWFHSGESDIIDTGLTMDDCQRRVPEMRGLGFDVDCERN